MPQQSLQSYTAMRIVAIQPQAGSELLWYGKTQFDLNCPEFLRLLQGTFLPEEKGQLSPSD